MPRATRILQKVTPAVKSFIPLESLGDPTTEVGRDKFVLFIALWSGSKDTVMYVEDPRTCVAGHDDSITPEDVKQARVKAENLLYLSDYKAWRLGVNLALPSVALYYETNKTAIRALVSEVSSVLTKKEMQARNLESACKSVRMSPSAAVIFLQHQGLVVKYKHKLGPGDDASKWAQYHLTESSTPTLMVKFADETVPLWKRIPGLTEDALGKIRDADPEEYDHKIPDIAIAHAFCYLTAAGYDFGNWYQGKKAVSAMSATFKKTWEAFYKHYLEISTIHKGLSYTRSIEEAIAVANGTSDEVRLRDRETVTQAMDREYYQNLAGDIGKLLETQTRNVAVEAIKSRLNIDANALEEEAKRRKVTANRERLEAREQELMLELRYEKLRAEAESTNRNPMASYGGQRVAGHP